MKKNEPSASEYLIFTCGAGRFAVAAACVQEILYPHAVTPLPFVPTCIDGLINIEGAIAVQVNLSQLIGQAHHQGNELVLINTERALCALKVDEVLGKLLLETESITPFLTDEYTSFHAEIDNIEADCFSGKTIHDGIAVLIVNHQRIGQLVQAGAAQPEGEGILGRINATDSMEEDMHITCLVVSSGKDLYAFELDGITEVVESGTYTPIPGAPDYLKGFHLVRDQALPVIDLVTMLGQPVAGSENGWIIIVERENFRYGLLVNTLQGIENFPLESYEPIVDPNSNLSGLFVYQEKTIVLLSPRRVVHDEIFETLSQHATFHSEEAIITAEETERYLQVSICENSYAIPIESVKRVSPFFPMEKIHDAGKNIRGAIDMNGSIIPVIALENALALKSLVENGEYVIVGNNQREWAICVDIAQGLVDVPTSQIKRMSNSNSRFVNGVANIKEHLVSLLDFSILQNQKDTLLENTQ
jgi:chemotaxis signal transduction protein